MGDLIKKIASWPLSFIAAFAKALGNSYGVLLLYCFLATGSLAIAASLLNPMVWLLLGCCAVSVFFVSCFMEGKALAKQIAKWLGVDPQHLRDFFNRLRRRFPRLHGMLTTILGAFAYLLAPLTYLVGHTAPLLAAFAKGATMAAGTIATLTLILTTIGVVTGPAGWIVGIAILFALGVFGASFCKEGFTFRRKFFDYCLPKRNILTSLLDPLYRYLWSPLCHLLNIMTAPIGRWQRRTPWVNKPLRALTQSIASLFPMAAALGKALGNGFGVLNFFNMYCQLPQIMGDISPEPGILVAYLIVLGIVGIAITVDSLSMEGYHLWHRLYKFINAFLNVQKPKEELDFELAFASNKVSQKLAAAHGQDPNGFVTPPPLSIRFLSFAAWVPSIIAGIAKGCTMGSGMAGILMLVFGLPALTSSVGMILGGVSLFCGFTVALVSIFKEGRILQRRLSKWLLKSIKGELTPTYGAQYEQQFTHDYQAMLTSKNHSEEALLEIKPDDFTQQYVAHYRSPFQEKTFTYHPQRGEPAFSFWSAPETDPFLGVPSSMNYGVVNPSAQR